MCEFIQKTFTDPALFWTALEAITTLFAALIIFWQLKQLRREAVAHKFEGFKYAMELLASSEFIEQCSKFQTSLDERDSFQFTTSLPPIVSRILCTLEIIDCLITDKYLDEKFLFRIEGLKLASLANNIEMIKRGKDMPRFEEEIRLYPNGYELLRRAEKRIK